MKKHLTVVLFILFSYCTAYGQSARADSLRTVLLEAAQQTVVLDTSMLEKQFQAISLGSFEGWLFHKGSDTTWSGKQLNTSDWRKLKPTDLSAQMSDENGRLEGWFRLNIITDSSFRNIPLSLRMPTWAATDVFLDGKKIAAYGNTGIDGHPYQENPWIFHSPVPLDIKASQNYTIAIHVVDYLSPFPPLRLKSEDVGFRHLIQLTGPENVTLRYYDAKKWLTFSFVWIMSGGVLSLLFWLLYSQNPEDKNLWLLALCSTSFALNVCGIGAAQWTKEITYVNQKLLFYAANFFGTTSYGLIPIILARTFNRRVTVYLLGFCILYFLLGFVLPSYSPNAFGTISFLALAAICLFYVITSWKFLKGAQWAIVAGLMTTLVGVALFIVNSDGTLDFPFALLYITIIYLSFPMGMLAYVAFRFKEIINDVKTRAQQIVELSEEKKEQALNQQKILEAEVDRQTVELRTSLEELKSAQSQLIQSEKMASLGELTAGIAHEIQNPLNFVNNFSEVNSELTDELSQAARRGDLNEVSRLAASIKENEEKIVNHGKRADSIVKSMLQHSRKSNGQKEPTDINALCDEYLRLSYHGLRAKDKSFNAMFETNFDPSVGQISVLPQEIGRVILNLINNAFYAVTEKRKTNPDGYEPSVIVRTKKDNGKVAISVIDNGNGIPPHIKDKIFQPFFTTKPTGQGTGLGLSLSYDIVKAHSGELRVETTEGTGSEFVITLPV